MVPTASRTLYADAPYWGEFLTITEVDFNTSAHMPSQQSCRCFRTRDGLSIRNLTPGDWIEIYSLHGLSITKQKASTETMNIYLPVRGIFVVKIGEFTEKIIL